MEIVKSFDGSSKVNCELIRFGKKESELGLRGYDNSFIPRGAGLSPRLLSAAKDGKSIILTDKIEGSNFEFDLEELTVKTDANATFADVNKAAFTFGCELPVIGYSSIQIGAGIASCIHGKNQFLYDFGNQVESFQLLLFSNEIITCSKSVNNIIFELTIGGYGSTGLILSATIKLKKILSTRVQRKRSSVASIQEFLKHYEQENIREFIGVFGWHNLHTKGRQLGGGFIYRDTHLANEMYMPGTYPVKPAHLYQPSPIYIPARVIFGSFFNLAYEIKERRSKKTTNFNIYSEAISSKNIYWSIMRANGFIEVQFIIPYHRINEFYTYLNDLLLQTKATTSVCITKPAMGERKYLRFRGKGVNIDITGVKSETNLAFFAELNANVKYFQGIPNITKCSILDEKTIQECYAEQYTLFFNDYKKELGKAPPSWFLQNGYVG